MLSLSKRLTMVQYSVKPESTADNIELIRGVYAQPAT
jgi:hypothetical protein